MERPVNEEIGATPTRAAGQASFRGLWTRIIQYAPGSLVPAAVGVVNSVIFTRVFGAEAYGRFSLVVGASALAAAVLSQWLQQGVGRFLPVADAAEQIQEIKAATALALIGTVAVATAAFAGCLLLGLRPRGSEWDPMIWPAWGLIITTALTASLATVLQAEMRAKLHSWYSIANVVTRLMLALALVFLVRRDVSSLVVASAITQGAFIPAMFRSAGLRLPRFRDASRPRTTLRIREMLAYGLPMVGYFIAASLLSVGDRYVIGAFRGAAEVGVYSANYTIVSWGVGLVTTPILLAAQPYFMLAWSRGEHSAAASWLATIVELFIAVGSLLVGGMFLFSADIARIMLGAEFRAGHHIMPIVLAGVLAWQVAMYTHKPLEFAGRTRLILVLSVAAALANIGGNLLLIPRMGYAAAAYTTLGSYILYAWATILLGKRVLPWAVGWRRVATTLLVAVIGFGATALARSWATPRIGYAPGLVLALLGATLTSALVAYRAVRLLAVQRSEGAPSPHLASGAANHE